MINGNRGRDKLLASSSTLGDGAPDTIRLLGGLEGDWVALVNGNTINGDTRVFGGGRPGYDHFYADLSNTILGEWGKYGFEGSLGIQTFRTSLTICWRSRESAEVVHRLSPFTVVHQP